tara:strand:- start:322 stop:879 length:558 start_codon:yes stop_codon:yes gene_type:complete
MKSILKSLIILFIYILPVNAACDFMVNIGEKGGKLFNKYGPPFPDFPGSFIMPLLATEMCPNDNLNEAIAIEYMFLGEKPEDAVLAGIKMIVLNDEKNTESNKLTLMKYAKKVYGDFDTGQNPQIYNNFNIWETTNKFILYMRTYEEDDRISEQLFISTKGYDKKLGEFYDKVEEAQSKAELGIE